MTESPSPIPMILDLARLACPDFVWCSIQVPSIGMFLVQGYKSPPIGGSQEQPALHADSLDSFARVLRAMPSQIQRHFCYAAEEAMREADEASCGCSILLRDPLTLWPLLHRAAFPEKYQ